MWFIELKVKGCWCLVFLDELLLNQFKSQAMYSVYQPKTSITQVNNELTKTWGGFSTKSLYILDFFIISCIRVVGLKSIDFKVEEYFEEKKIMSCRIILVLPVLNLL